MAHIPDHDHDIIGRIGCKRCQLDDAAPELLAACRQAFYLIKESGFVSGLDEETFDKTLRELDTAITKATR